MARAGTVLVALATCACAAAVVFKEDARPSVYNDLVCELPDGSGGVCRPPGNCTSEAASAAAAAPCVASGQVCCRALPSPPPAAGVGIKSRAACEKRAELAKASECPPIEMIPGKNTVLPGQFPYLVEIGYGNRTAGRWLCGGALVSESFVLTSAVCLGNRAVGIVKRVRLADAKLPSASNETGQVLDVDDVYPHPLYKPRGRYHDLALLHLHTPAKLSNRVRPACLNALPQLPTNHLIISGFGSEGLAVVPDAAHYVDVTEVPTETCQNTLPQLARETMKINASMICAGDINGGRDSCRGDSGAPLQIRVDKPHCQFSIVGITSFGPRVCGQPKVPSVYTRVSSYLPWIESIVWP